MQHGETGAALPRNLARQVGKAVCDAHNNNELITPWLNKRGKSLDRTGTFVQEIKKKRQVKVPI